MNQRYKGLTLAVVGACFWGASGTMIQFLAPVFIIIYSSLRSKMWPRRIDAISIVVAVVGTFILATGGRFDQLALSPLACFWGLIAAFSEAINTVLPGKLFKKYGPIPVIGAAMLVAGIAFLPIYFTQPMPKLAPVDVWVIVYIIIGGTLLAYTMYLSSVQYIEPSTVGMLGAFEPLIATILSVSLLHADFGPMDMFGGFLIIVATFMQLMPSRNPIKKNNE